MTVWSWLQYQLFCKIFKKSTVHHPVGETIISNATKIIKENRINNRNNNKRQSSRGINDSNNIETAKAARIKTLAESDRRHGIRTHGLNQGRRSWTKVVTKLKRILRKKRGTSLLTKSSKLWKKNKRRRTRKRKRGMKTIHFKCQHFFPVANLINKLCS